MLDLMYITKNPDVAQIAEKAGVDWIFVDMEFLGKELRQGGLDTVQNHHTVEDVANIKAALSSAKVLVRVNPLHDTIEGYPSSKDEIASVIDAGADIVMLPFFKTVEEVEYFIKIVDGRAKVCLLVETPEAAALLEDIVEVPGIDMIHFGLNDMHLAFGMKFMFQLLADGSVDKWTNIVCRKGIQYGFGGLASLNGGAVPGRMILKEHYRLGSQMVILSRAFCNADKMTDMDEVSKIFTQGVADIRELEKEVDNMTHDEFMMNHRAVCEAVESIVNG